MALIGTIGRPAPWAAVTYELVAPDTTFHEIGAFQTRHEIAFITDFNRAVCAGQVTTVIANRIRSALVAKTLIALTALVNRVGTVVAAHLSADGTVPHRLIAIPTVRCVTIVALAKSRTIKAHGVITVTASERKPSAFCGEEQVIARFKLSSAALQPQTANGPSIIFASGLVETSETGNIGSEAAGPFFRILLGRRCFFLLLLVVVVR